MKMTGRQILTLLAKLPDEYLDIEAFTEGCDCYGDVESIKVLHSNGKPYLLFARDAFGAREKGNVVYVP